MENVWVSSTPRSKVLKATENASLKKTQATVYNDSNWLLLKNEWFLSIFTTFEKNYGNWNSQSNLDKE